MHRCPLLALSPARLWRRRPFRISPGNGRGKTRAGDTFTINLTQKKDIIKGSHEATAENGAKVDSSNGEIIIYGKYVDGAFLVEFRSCGHDTKGRAMMRLEDKGKVLLWQLVIIRANTIPSGQLVT